MRSLRFSKNGCLQINSLKRKKTEILYFSLFLIIVCVILTNIKVESQTEINQTKDNCKK